MAHPTYQSESEEDYDDRMGHEFLHTLKDILKSLQEIARDLKPKKHHLFIIWIGQGKTIMANDVTLNLTAPFGTNQSVPVETENGGAFTFNPANIQWQVQDNTVASFVQNPDGSATWTPMKAGSTGVAVSDSATGADAQGTLTVTGTANTFAMSITWQTPASGAIGAASRRIGS